MADSSCQFRTLVLLLCVTYAQSARINQFDLNPVSNGQIELVCDIADIEEDRWIAIYRYYGHFAECIFWEQANVTNGPFSCTGDFQVSITRPADKNVKYKVLYNLPISSQNEGDYFCRVLSIADNGEYVLESGALDLIATQNDVRQADGYIDNGNFPSCSPTSARYSAGDSIELTCTALGKVPATVQWKRNRKIIEGYPKIFHHGVDPGGSETGRTTTNRTEFYNKDGYILVTTKMTVTLTEADESTFFTCEMFSPSSPSAQKCEIGPFILEGSGGTDSELSGNCTGVAPATVLGLDIWLFTTIIAFVIIGILIVSNIVVSICYYKSKKKATYLLRKGSQHPILAHDETEMEDQIHAYDSSKPTHMKQNGGNNIPHGGENMAHIGGHMSHNGGRPYIDVTIEDKTNESPYSPYPQSEFEYDWGPEHDAVYSNTEEVSNQTRVPRESVYGNTITRKNNNKTQSLYENH